MSKKNTETAHAEFLSRWGNRSLNRKKFRIEYLLGNKRGSVEIRKKGRDSSEKIFTRFLESIAPQMEADTDLHVCEILGVL